MVSYLPIVTAAESNWLALFQQSEYTLETTITGYFNKPSSPNADSDDIAGLGKFSMQSNIALSDTISTGFNLYALFSSQKQAYSGVFRNPGHNAVEPRIVDFNQAWLRYEADNFEILLGKDYLELGLASLYSPVDRFGLYNLANPTQAEKIGVWQASIYYFFNDDIFSVKVMPVYERNLLPSAYSRWLGNTQDPEFTALADQYEIQDYYRPVRFENVGYLISYKGMRAGYDFFANLHHGASIYPTLQLGNLENQRIKIDPLATSIAVGVLKVIDAWQFYTEAIYQHSDQHTDENFVRYAWGLGYQDIALANELGLNHINATLQWSGDETVTAADYTKVDTSSRAARPFRNTVLMQLELEQSHQWAYVVSTTHNIADDFALMAGIQYKPNDNLRFRLEAAYFNGTETSHFGRWQENDYLRCKVQYKF